MSKKVCTALRRHGLDAVRVENPAGPGTPDVNYIEGWIENKWVRRWPKRADTVVRLDHFTPQQRVWLLRRSQRGGRVHLLLKVEETWLLFRGDVAAEVVGRANKAQLHGAAIRVWSRGLVEKELIECLRSV